MEPPHPFNSAPPAPPTAHSSLTDKKFVDHHVILLKQPALDKVPEDFRISLAHQRLHYLYVILNRRFDSTPDSYTRIRHHPYNPPPPAGDHFVITLLDSVANNLNNETLTVDERCQLAYKKLDDYYGVTDDPLPQDTFPEDTPEIPQNGFPYDTA